MDSKRLFILLALWLILSAIMFEQAESFMSRKKKEKKKEKEDDLISSDAVKNLKAGPSVWVSTDYDFKTQNTDLPAVSMSIRRQCGSALKGHCSR